MRKILFILMVFTLVLITIGCRSNQENPLSTMEENTEEKSLSYKIEKITLSKGFQSTEPNVEILDKTKKFKLLANIGLIESSGIEINKITKSDKSINIYVNRLLESGEVQLAVPKVILEFEDPIDENIEDLKFNIINQNYDLVSLKFNKDQILDKIYNHFKIEPSSIPDVKLTKLKDQIYWQISFNNIFDKEDIKSPLVNLNVKVDADTGKILGSAKKAISTYIDDGVLLDYLPNDYLLYKQHYEENDASYEILWIYNLSNGQKDKLYTSKNKIQSANFNPDGEYISIIEAVGDNSDLYLVQIEEKIAYKITPDTFLHPKLMKWKDDETLYFIDIKDETSTLLTYNVKENTSNQIFKVDKFIESFDILDNKLIFTEPEIDSVNKNIYFYEHEDNIKQIGVGFKASFLDDQNIIYLENVEEENKNILYEYNINNHIVEDKLNQDIVNYYKLDENNMLLIEKNTYNNDYTINRFNIIENKLTAIAKINSDKIFYDSNTGKGYINLCPPYDNDNLSIIYSVDLDKLELADIKN